MAQRTHPHSAPRSSARPAPASGSALQASILDALGEAVVASDLERRVIYWNESAEALYGWSAAEALGADLGALLAANRSRADAVAILRRLQAGEAWSGDFVVKHRDGRFFPVNATTSPVRDGSGRVVGMVAVARDPTAQREAEEALRQSEERLALVHRATAAGIWECDLQTGERRWSTAVADSFGYAPEDVEPTLEWWAQRVHPEDRQRVVSGVSDALADGRQFWSDEYRFLRGDGVYATVFDRAYVASDSAGVPVRVVGTMLDLTEHRRAQEAAAFLTQAGILLDLSMDYEAALPGLARLAVASVADVCVLVLGTLDCVEHVAAAAADPVRQGAVDRIATRLARGGVAGTLTGRVLQTGESILLPDFSPALLAEAELDEELGAASDEAGLRGLIVTPVLARGRTLGTVLLGRCSGSPRPGEEDVRMAEELGRRLGLAVDNARLFQSAEQARRAKTDFLSVVSHELRTPLTAVMGYSDLLTAEIAGTLNTSQRHQVDRIRAGGEQLLRVIDGILDYARLETGRERPQLEWQPLERVLEQVRRIVTAQAAERGVRLQEDLAGVPEVVCVDVLKLARVLQSLLSNAIKFAGEGGRAGLRVAMEDERLIFDVWDTGPGIAPRHVPHLFDPFWQAEEPEIRLEGGSGLGLSVARRLARLMGGEVVILDSSEAGTTFRLTLPVPPGG